MLPAVFLPSLQSVKLGMSKKKKTIVLNGDANDKSRGNQLIRPDTGELTDYYFPFIPHYPLILYVAKEGLTRLHDHRLIWAFIAYYGKMALFWYSIPKSLKPSICKNN